MPTFRSPHNPSFKLRTSNLRVEFTDGTYTTDDLAEVAALRRASGVEEVTAPPEQPYAGGLKTGGVVPRGGVAQVVGQETVITREQADALVDRDTRRWKGAKPQPHDDSSS